jgi:hypothetical protein
MQVNVRAYGKINVRVKLNVGGTQIGVKIDVEIQMQVDVKLQIKVKVHVQIEADVIIKVHVEIDVGNLLKSKP